MRKVSLLELAHPLLKEEVVEDADAEEDSEAEDGDEGEGAEEDEVDGFSTVMMALSG